MTPQPFTAAQYDEHAFKNVTQQEIKAKVFNDCTFSRCTFTETLFQECTFRNCAFTDCDLSLARVKNSIFSGAHFENCKVVGVNWTEAEWSKAGLLGSSLEFINCTLNYSTFFGLKLKKAAFTRCIAHDVDFTEADLTGANCSQTDFSESRFHQTNLTEADFTHATHYAIAVQHNIIKKAKFSLPEAMSLLYGLDIVLVE